MRRVRVKKLYDDFEKTFGRRPNSSHQVGLVDADNNPVSSIRIRGARIVCMSERRHLKRNWMRRK